MHIENPNGPYSPEEWMYIAHYDEWRADYDKWMSGGDKDVLLILGICLTSCIALFGILYLIFKLAGVE